MIHAILFRRVSTWKGLLVTSQYVNSYTKIHKFFISNTEFVHDYIPSIATFSLLLNTAAEAASVKIKGWRKHTHQS